MTPQQMVGNAMPELVTTLIIGSYLFAAGGYAFTFRYLQSTAKALWDGIAQARTELKGEIEKAQTDINRVVANDLHHLEERVTRLEDHR